ncbi:MAG: DEAD/DEAH box helicase, partial [Acidimicrobiia bacterium]|nr:DEAD/DEAH box helicase [Acidimicrobiia bacterium]
MLTAASSATAEHTTFSALGVADDLCARLAQRNRTTPFPIQAEAIPPALAGADLCGRAPTGSGKTLAFGLPIAQRVAKARPGRPRALVLAPTRELAGQIETELKPLLAVRKRFVASFYGGVGFGPQLRALRRGVDVAVGCP